MIAGRDTVRLRQCCDFPYLLMYSIQTAATLTFAVYLLAMYPETAARLRAEILEKVGASQCPSYDDIREMKFLRAFINGEEISQLLLTI